jgi:hypothetical protein
MKLQPYPSPTTSCIWTQLALFEGCEEQVEVLVGDKDGEEEEA